MKQTVTSKYEPKSKNVTWIDMSTGHPVLKNFINGMWRPTGSGSGSGASSSNPTETDATKVWQVTPVQKGTKTEETVIVPEQTCNMEDNGKQTKCTLQNVDESFVLGFSGIVILDGVEYEIEWGEKTFGFLIGSDSYCAIEYAEYENEYYLCDHNKGLTHTIKVITRETEPIYDYNWAPGVKIPIPTAEDEGKILVVTKIEPNYEYQLQSGGGGSSNILYCEGSDDGYGLITAYIDSSELDNQQITTIAVHISGEDDYDYYFYRMMSRGWLVSGFSSFENRDDWVKSWDTSGQYPTIEAYFTNNR